MRIALFPSALSGSAAAPPSKSFAHRAILCAALSHEPCRIENFAPSRDMDATLGAMQALGCRSSVHGDTLVLDAPAAFATPATPIDCGESGSTLRFLIPLLSLLGQPVRLVGHGRLMERPQQVYAGLLPTHGTAFRQNESGITISGALQPGYYSLPGNVSSQFVSGLLFALPLLASPSTLTIVPPVESRSYIEITRSVQACFGVQSTWRSENELSIPAPQRYRPCGFSVEGDYSQAAFLAVLGAVRGGIAISGLSCHTLQGDAAILDILARCGAQSTHIGEQIAFTAAPLSATDIDLADCPDLGPILMVLATLCRGTTVIRHAGRLRLKESDRIAAMEAELAKFGAVVSSEQDTVMVRGGGRHAPGEALSSHNDHRIAMSLAVLALALGVPVTIDGAEAVNKSWPAFWEVLRRLGAKWEVTA